MKDRKKWESILQRWSKSGLSQSAFCEREQLKLSTFQYKKSQLKTQSEPQFVEVGRDREPEVIEIVATNGVRICLPLDTSSERLSELAQCLR